jgi:HEAT repeat protein
MHPTLTIEPMPLKNWVIGDPTPEVLTACLAALNDPEEEVREEAVLALETLEDPSAIPALERVAREDPSEDVRDAAVEALEYLMD